PCATSSAAHVSVDAWMSELHAGVRERLRERLLSHGASRDFEDPALFADVERILQSAVSTGDAQVMLLPELLGDGERWRLQTAMRYESHRASGVASIILFIKRRMLMPMFRWLFEYS